MFGDVVAVLDQRVAKRVDDVCIAFREMRDALEDVEGEVEAVEVVADGHVERCGGGAFLLVAADVEVVVVRTAVGEAVDEPRVAVVGEDDGTVSGEERVEFAVVEPVGMLAGRLQGEQVDHVDDPDPQFRDVVSEIVDCGEGLEGGDVPGASHDDVGLAAVVVGGPRPEPDSLGAMADGFVHVEPLQFRLFARDDDVDVIAAA